MKLKLFDLKEKQVIIAPEALLIKEFKALWDRDKTRSKEKAIEDLAYVFYIADISSPYRNYDEEVRSEKVKESVISQPDWKEDDAIKKAISKYKEIHKTYSMGLLEDVEYGLFKIRQYFRNAAEGLADDTAGKVTEQYLSNVEKVQKMLTAIKNLKDIVDKEMVENARIRGGGTINPREVPKSKRDKYTKRSV